MYYLFVKHSLLPGDYYRLPAGEKLVLRAFFEKRLEAFSERASLGPKYDKNAITARR